MNRSLFILVLLLISSPVYAEWALIGGDNEAGMALYVDPALISQNETHTTLWVLYDFKTAQTKGSGESFSSAKIQREYDCPNELTRVLKVTNYAGDMGSGKEVANQTVDNPKWGSLGRLDPGTVARSLWDIACGKK
jgi:hypothetical protein